MVSKFYAKHSQYSVKILKTIVLDVYNTDILDKTTNTLVNVLFMFMAKQDQRWNLFFIYQTKKNWFTDCTVM